MNVQGIVPGNFTLANYNAVFAKGSDDLAALIRTTWLAFGTASVIRRTHLMRQEHLGHCCQRHHSDLSQGQDRHAEHYQTRRLLRIVPIPMPAASNTTRIPMSKMI